MEKVRGWARVELIFSDKTAFLTAPNSTERTKMQINTGSNLHGEQRQHKNNNEYNYSRPTKINT